MDEEKYKEELKANGVELPAEEQKDEKTEAAPKPEAKSEGEPEEKAKDPEPLQEKTPKEQEPPPRKRSIYEVYKDEKNDRKAAEERAANAEKERDDWKGKFEAVNDAKPGQETKDAEDDLRTYAAKKGADPELVDRIIAEARKGLKAEIDPELKTRLDNFEAWQKTNSKVVEKQMFDDEFKRTAPALAKLFPGATDAEMDTIKAELDTISHTKEWHDKSLGYIAFEHQEKLGALVSPKKRGMESKGRKDVDSVSTEFDPNANLADMSPADREKWEASYKQLTKNDGLLKDEKGRRMLI